MLNDWHVHLLARCGMASIGPMFIVKLGGYKRVL